MKLHKDSFIVRYAYFGSEDGPPKQTSICPFFWRCVFRTLLYLFPFALVVGYILLWMSYPQKALRVSIAFVGIPATVYVLTRIEDKVKNRVKKIETLKDIWDEERWNGGTKLGFKAWRKQYRIEHSLFWATFYSFKDRVCPIITIEQ